MNHISGKIEQLLSLQTYYMREIDFVCEKRGERLYIQVSYLLASQGTINREFDAYREIKDNYPKYVLSMDEFDMSRDGIKHRNARDFLLMEEWGQEDFYQVFCELNYHQFAY